MLTVAVETAGVEWCVLMLSGVRAEEQGAWMCSCSRVSVAGIFQAGYGGLCRGDLVRGLVRGPGLRSGIPGTGALDKCRGFLYFSLQLYRHMLPVFLLLYGEESSEYGVDRYRDGGSSGYDGVDWYRVETVLSGSYQNRYGDSAGSSVYEVNLPKYGVEENETGYSRGASCRSCGGPIQSVVQYLDGYRPKYGF